MLYRLGGGISKKDTKISQCGAKAVKETEDYTIGSRSEKGSVCVTMCSYILYSVGMTSLNVEVGCRRCAGRGLMYIEIGKSL
jgi:hypothetical protein